MSGQPFERPFLLRLLDNIERKILLRAYGVDSDAARKLDVTGGPVHDRVYEVRTREGWRVWQRDSSIRTHD